MNKPAYTISDQIALHFQPYFLSLSARTVPRCSERGGGFTQAGVSQRFERAIHFQICTNVRAGIHPRLRETARCVQVICLNPLFFITLTPFIFIRVSLLQRYKFFIVFRTKCQTCANILIGGEAAKKKKNISTGSIAKLTPKSKQQRYFFIFFLKFFAD
jgi:hypothetical protein